MAQERVLGGVGTKVLFENDRVRVWEMRLEPGERGAVHRHDLDHLLIEIDGDKMAVEPEPDTEGPYKDYLEGDITPGAVIYVTRGGVETAVNVGSKPFHEIIVELKA
jgi:quercetin dioxygenase-like cupin family protein